MADFNIMPDGVLAIKSFIESLGFNTKAHSGEPCLDPKCYVIHAFGGHSRRRDFIIFINRSGMVLVRRRVWPKSDNFSMRSTVIGDPVLDISLSNPECFDKLSVALNS